MISVNGLTRTYGDFIAVNNISLSINSGEVVGLLGHNGAGKTTLMKMLTGYLEPDEGKIVVDGLDLNQHRTLIQQKIGYLPENCPVYSDMAVIEYLRYVAKLHELNSKQVSSAVRKAIERTELEEKATASIATLSRGLRQRVGVAQAILHEPQILILDEPTNGLDPSQIHHMRDLIRELAQTATVIVSTHILQEVQAVCDRVIILRRGAKVMDTRLDELNESNQLIIEVNAPAEKFLELLAGMDLSVQSIVSQEGEEFITYTLSGTGDIKALSPQVARVIQENGYDLLALHPLKRELETVFGEINTVVTKEVKASS